MAGVDRNKYHSGSVKKREQTQQWLLFLWIDGTKKICRRPPMSGSVHGDKDRKGAACSYLSGRIMPGLTGIIMGRGWRIMCGGPGIICIGPPIGGLMPPKCHGDGEHSFRFLTFGIESHRTEQSDIGPFWGSSAWKCQRSQCLESKRCKGFCFLASWKWPFKDGDDKHSQMFG